MNLLLLTQPSFRELLENLAEEVWKEPKDLGFVKNVTKYYMMLIVSDFLEIKFVVSNNN